jgi:hypothetical protein
MDTSTSEAQGWHNDDEQGQGKMKTQEIEQLLIVTTAPPSDS